MRSRVSLLVLLFTVVSFVLPQFAHAGGIPFLGPIIPDALNKCAAGWGMLMDVVNNIISFLITIAIVFIAPLMIAWSGFLFVVNPVNASGKETAKKILTNTIVGIVLALAGWMIVDAIMAVLYNSGAQVSGGTIGVWSNLITSGGEPSCLIQEALLQDLDQVSVTGSTAGGGLTTTAGPGQLIRGFALGCTASNDQNANELAGRGIEGHSTANCCAREQSTCTSLDGMLSSTIQQIENLQTTCGGITVTGGTETGHSGEGGTDAHSGGAKVDIGQNLISCIMGTRGSSGVYPPSFGVAQARDSCGNIYTWEGNHTDIYVRSSCSLRN